MEMHKLEVYTQQKELPQVPGDLPGNPRIVGALDVHFHRRGRLNDRGAAADTRIEIFTESDPVEIMARLAALESVLDIQSYPCKPFCMAREDTQPALNPLRPPRQ